MRHTGKNVMYYSHDCTFFVVQCTKIPCVQFKGGPKSVIVEDETSVIILYLQQQFDILTEALLNHITYLPP